MRTSEPATRNSSGPSCDHQRAADRLRPCSGAASVSIQVQSCSPNCQRPNCAVDLPAAERSSTGRRRRRPWRRPRSDARRRAAPSRAAIGASSAERRGEGLERRLVELLRAERVVEVAGRVHAERREADRAACRAPARRSGRYSGALPVSGTNKGIVGPAITVEEGVVDRVDRGCRCRARPASMCGAAAFQTSSTFQLGPPLAPFSAPSSVKGSPSDGVDVHRQVELRLAGRGDLVDVAGDVPGVEGLVGARAEHLGSRCRRGAELRGQLGRDRPVEQPLRLGREVARAAVAAGLVLGLDHDHRVLRIVVAQMPHQPDEGALSASSVARPCGREDIMGAAVAGAHAREALGVGLDPFGRVAGAGVLPGAEPQQHQPHVVARAPARAARRGRRSRTGPRPARSAPRRPASRACWRGARSIAGQTCGSIAG